MAAGHQLKKLAHSRTNNHHHIGPVTKHGWIDYMPKHWSVYTLIFSTASLLLFCFLFYDVQSSPTSLMLHASRQMGALKAQMSESYLFASSTKSSPSEVVVVDGSKSDTASTKQQDKVQLPDSETERKASLISKEDLRLIREEFPETVEESASVKPLEQVVSSQAKDNFKVSVEEEAEEGDVAVEEVKNDTEASSEENTGESDIADLKTVKREVEDTLADADADASVEEVISSEASVESTGGSDIADLKTLEREAEKTVADADASAEVVLSSEASVPDGTCDWSEGKWVYDESYPIYKPNTCPWIDGGFRCVENGRPSSEFQKYRWQPSGCDLPRFDSKDMLERLRNSRMVFVGDSIGRNNWESMLCMLSESVSNKSRVYEINGEAITKHSGFLIYRFEDYNCTVEYYRSPHLVPQGRAPPNSDPRVRSTLKLDIMDWSSSKWRTADIVIFNTGHWWSFEKTIRGGNYFQEGRTVHLNMTVGEAFRRAMETVARFVEKNMDPEKSQVFFRSYAPVHFKGGTWDHGGTCNADMKPLQKFPFVWQDRTPSVMIKYVMETNVKNPVNFLNITYLSDLRPDGHSSIWQRVPPSPRNHQDCSHWCLPGVPDTWNEIVLATLLKNGQGKWGIQKKNS